MNSLAWLGFSCLALVAMPLPAATPLMEVRQAVIRAPDAPHLYGNTKLKGQMDPYGDKLSAEEIDELTSYVYALRDSDDAAKAHPQGAELFESAGCSTCHEVQAGVTNDGPNFFRYASDAWLTALIEAPGTQLYYGAANEMPTMKQKLKADEIAVLVKYVRSLEGEQASAVTSSR